ncbi:MS Related Protein [Caenorhabditis elegans]|uniref:MS Related Protein n=1 Tax=Caenorhabditis elegans TaxID=6239 RepID=O16595_CAEEL|nr:MS Related Protein [Caenorhabditis elegans]CCD68441.1 MS Related Protein [Caenorhabditis elegans]|eukprot:NP_494306.1 MS Related Protein [Caenorhabditis elegans]
MRRQTTAIFVLLGLLAVFVVQGSTEDTGSTPTADNAPAASNGTTDMEDAFNKKKAEMVKNSEEDMAKMEKEREKNKGIFAKILAYGLATVIVTFVVCVGASAAATIITIVCVRRHNRNKMGGGGQQSTGTTGGM